MCDCNGRNISIITAVLSALVCACSILVNSDFERASPDREGFDGAAGSAGTPGGMNGGGMDGGGGTGANKGGLGAIAGIDGGYGADEDDSGVADGTGGSEATTSLEDGLVAYYPFSGNADDWSGNGNDGTVNGAALTEDRFGNVNAAYSFDGVDDHIDCGNDDSLRIQGALTISAWIKIGSYSSMNQGIVAKWSGSSPSSERAYSLSLQNESECPDQVNSHISSMTISSDGYCRAGGSYSCSFGCADVALSIDTWYHIVGVFEPSASMKVYLNGRMEGFNGDEIVSEIYDSTINLVIGNSYDLGSPSNFFNGVIDDVRVYNRPLTASEVRALYEEGDANCVAEYYRRCGADGNVHWYDSCKNDEGVAVDCPEQHATCVNLADNASECRCANHWEGDDCNSCPSPWDSFEGCWGFFDDFESGLGNWLVSGQDWALDDGTARSGDHCLSDSPGAVPLANTDASAIMVDSVNLSESVNPVLRFWGKALLGDSGDHIRVYASTDSGLTWDSLWDTGYSSIAHWYPQQIDLGAYIGSKIKIRFQFTTDNDSNLGDGWWIDDVWLGERDTALLPYPFFDDFESGLDNWLLSGKDWDLTDTDFRSASYSLTDSPAGNYIADAYPFATLAQPVDLSTSTAPVLTFWYRGSLGDSGDELLVYASQDAGTNWTEIWSRSGGTVSTWTLVQVDLSSYAGSPLALAFSLLADGDDYLADGWYIDDVEIGEL